MCPSLASRHGLPWCRVSLGVHLCQPLASASMFAALKVKLLRFISLSQKAFINNTSVVPLQGKYKPIQQSPVIHNSQMHGHCNMNV